MSMQDDVPRFPAGKKPLGNQTISGQNSNGLHKEPFLPKGTAAAAPLLRSLRYGPTLRLAGTPGSFMIGTVRYFLPLSGPQGVSMPQTAPFRSTAGHRAAATPPLTGPRSPRGFGRTDNDRGHRQGSRMSLRRSLIIRSTALPAVPPRSVTGHAVLAAGARQH